MGAPGTVLAPGVCAQLEPFLPPPPATARGVAHGLKRTSLQARAGPGPRWLGSEKPVVPEERVGQAGGPRLQGLGQLGSSSCRLVPAGCFCVPADARAAPAVLAPLLPGGSCPGMVLISMASKTLDYVASLRRKGTCFCKRDCEARPGQHLPSRGHGCFALLGPSVEALNPLGPCLFHGPDPTPRAFLGLTLSSLAVGPAQPAPLCSPAHRAAPAIPHCRCGCAGSQAWVAPPRRVTAPRWTSG